MSLFGSLKDTAQKHLTRLWQANPGEDVSEAVKTATIVNTPKFSLETNGRRLPGRVIEVYDGDTVVIAMNMYSKVSAFKIRLANINTPELKPAIVTEDRANIVAKAKAARDFLASEILGKIVWVDIKGFEKYGRLLCDIYAAPQGAISVNQKMIDSGHAVQYSGGSKTKTKTVPMVI